MSRDRTMVILAVGVLALASSTARTEQTSSANAAAVKVTLRALKTAVDGPTRQAASGDLDLTVGQTGTLTFAATDDLCGVAMGADPARLGAPHHEWRVRLTLVRAETDRIALDVTTDRRDEAAGQASHDERRVVLIEGSRHVLDFVNGAAGQTPSCRSRNLLLELSADLVDPPGLPRVFACDLWLTHRDAAGHSHVRHEIRTGLHGEELAFRFQPIQWPMSVLRPSAAVALTLDERVSGTIRARLRGDGSIDVSITTRRELAHVTSGGYGATGGEQGRKWLAVAPGEVVSIALPTPSGHSGVRRSDGSATVLDYAELFRDDAAALTLRITPVG
jgi:hypothetical protein